MRVIFALGLIMSAGCLAPMAANAATPTIPGLAASPTARPVFLGKIIKGVKKVGSTGTSTRP